MTQIGVMIDNYIIPVEKGAGKKSCSEKKFSIKQK